MCGLPVTAAQVSDETDVITSDFLEIKRLLAWLSSHFI